MGARVRCWWFFPTVLIAAGGAAGADLRAVPVSVCLRVIQLLFPQLAREGLLLFALLRGLSVSHGDLLLVQRQSVRGRSHLASTAVLLSQHGRFGHLRVKERKEVSVAPLGGSLGLPHCKHKHLTEDQCDSALIILGFVFHLQVYKKKELMANLGNESSEYVNSQSVG